MHRTVIVSDLHLSLGPDYHTEDFYAQEAFDAMLRSPLLDPNVDEQVDLVLLGDTFDLWQTALEDEEYRAQDSSSIALEYTEQDEESRLRRVQQAHPNFFESLCQFARRPCCELTIVFGNHDHSLIDKPVVQRTLRSIIGETVSFAAHFDAPDLGLYAEHGNQWEVNNAYDDFERFGVAGECPGYFFVRLFWNRLETIEPRLGSVPHTWRDAWHYLVAIPKVLPDAIRLWVQYRRDDRVPRSIDILARGAEERDVRGIPQADGPDLLAAGTKVGENVFSNSVEIERALREAYHANAEVRKAVDEVRGAHALAVPRADAAVAARLAAPAWAREELEGRDGATRLFEEPPTGRPLPLDRQTYHFVVFGHTHSPGESQLDNRAWYFNARTWSGRDRTRMPLLIAEADNQRKRAGLAWFEDGRVEVESFREA